MEHLATQFQPSAVPEFLSGGGEMGQRMREFDWSKTALGPVHTWPQSLRTCVRIMLTSRQPMWIGWGRDLIKLYNDPYKAIVRGKHPQALGQPASIVWKDIWRDIEPMLKKVMDNDEGTYVESQLLLMERNGYPEETYYTFSYTPIPGDNGGTAGMICANTDDTDRIISERQLKTLTTLGKSLTNCQSNEDVIERTIDSLENNQADFPFVLFYSIKADTITLARTTQLGAAGDSLPQNISVQENTPFATCIKQAIDNKQLQVFTGVQNALGTMPTGAWEVSSDKAIVLPIVQSNSKEPYGILVTGLNPYRLFDEKYSSFFNLVTDQIATSFADVHVLEEERKRAEALAEIDRAKTLFFSNISHEFRTPLTLLLSPIEEMLNDPQTNPRQKILVDVAYRNALRMQKLVNTLLEFSRIEAGRMQGRFVPVDIGAITQDLASVFRSAIEKAGMELIIRCDEITGEVYVDPDMWERIILNLVSNAFKYSKKGTIKVEVKQQNQLVQVLVSDTGVGIPADQLDKIFDRFHRVENAESRSLEGTGIGLAMVKELVKLHQGTIQVTSLPGKGSTFTVTLPIGKKHLPADKIDDAAVTAESNYKHSTAFVEEALKWLPSEKETTETTTVDTLIGASQRTGHLYKVLLADDNADMRNYVQRLLADQFLVITATDGEDAFQKALTYKPDLLLSDIMMPRLDGFGLLKKIRQQPETKNIPVIFLSARAGEEAKVEGLDAGADDYLVKPFSAKELLVRVSNLIRINEVRRETEHQFYQLFMQAPAFINVLRGPDFRVELFHPKNKEILGDVDFTGMPLREALPELEQQGVFDILSWVYTTGNTYRRQEEAVMTLDNKGQPVTRYFNVTYQPWYDIKGNVQGVLTFSIEETEAVTSRKKIEDSEKQYRELTEQLEAIVEKRTEELKRSNDDLQQFAHVASHDLKEPVRKFKTFIARLKDEYAGSLPQKGQDYLDKMQNAAERMAAMIEGVLKYSLLDASDRELTMIDLDAIINSIETDLEVAISQKKAHIHKTQLPRLEGDATLIYQLFYNLINNSLKFSSNEPEITIACTIIKNNGKEYATITVADNGIGFDQPDAHKIFNAFTRLNSKDRYEGTGLGLALCKKIVERHQGNIAAVGESDKGAVFTIQLPMVQDRKLTT